MAPRRPRSYLKALSSLSRINMLHQLQTHDSMTVTELASATGLHHNTAREHLHTLIDAGFVVSEPIPRNSKGRPKMLYRAASQPHDPAHQARRHAAEIRTEQYRRLIPVRAVNSGPASLQRQLDMLDDHMDQCGFDSIVDTDADTAKMTMHSCPFGDLAKDNPQVCQVHFALVQDALRLTEGPISAREIHPFSSPTECTVHLNIDA